MTATDNLDNLLASLTWEDWFDYLPVIADAYGELQDWAAAEACRWLADNKKRPHRGDVFYWFNLSLRMDCDISTQLPSLFVWFLNGKEENHYSIQDILARFVEVWKEGVRP